METPPPPAPSTTGWGAIMRDRAANAKSQLAPQLLSMREKTSKQYALLCSKEEQSGWC